MIIDIKLSLGIVTALVRGGIKTKHSGKGEQNPIKEEKTYVVVLSMPIWLLLKMMETGITPST